MPSAFGSKSPERLIGALPTLEDVAERAGVSTATVSRCLTSPERVQERTRLRVLRVVDELGYAPNFGARALAAKRTNTVAAIIPTMENAIFARGVQAFQEELGRFGQTLLIASSSYRADLEAEQIKTLVARGADAFLLIGHDRNPAIYDFLKRRGVPYLVTWAFDADAEEISIGFDNRAAMQALAREVLTAGHKRLAVISAPCATNDRARERVEGIRAALSEAGLPASDLDVVETEYSVENGARAFEALMAHNPRPTAVMCGNDVLAVGALAGARRMGMDVPGDVSITGFDDIEIAQIVTPKLTTVHVPHREMGRQAARLLVEMIDGTTPVTSRRLETSIELRETLGPPTGA